LKGDVLVRFYLGNLPRDEVGVPHPVIAHVTARFGALDPTAWPGALVHQRWDRAREILLRCPWTEAVSVELARLRADHPDANELDRTVAAHALAHGGAVVAGTLAAKERFAAFSGLRVDHWG
jgi:hypothetical protein